MIDERKFSGGMLKLAAAVRQTLTDADFEAYEVLRKHGSTDEWIRYVDWCLETGEFSERWPILQDFRDSFARWRMERQPKLTGTVGKCEKCEGTGFEYVRRRAWTGLDATYVVPCGVCRPEKPMTGVNL